jgi:hypothetical protein
VVLGRLIIEESRDCDIIGKFIKEIVYVDSGIRPRNSVDNTDKGMFDARLEDSKWVIVILVGLNALGESDKGHMCLRAVVTFQGLDVPNRIEEHDGAKLAMINQIKSQRE